MTDRHHHSRCIVFFFMFTIKTVSKEFLRLKLLIHWWNALADPLTASDVHTFIDGASWGARQFIDRRRIQEMTSLSMTSFLYR